RMPCILSSHMKVHSDHVYPSGEAAENLPIHRPSKDHGSGHAETLRFRRVTRMHSITHYVTETWPLKCPHPDPVTMMKSTGYLEETYELCCQTLGSGAGGVVQMVKRRADGAFLALKAFRYRKHSNLKLEVAQRRAILTFNIVEYIESVIESERPYLVTEYCPHDFFEWIQADLRPLSVLNKYFQQLLSGVNYLHTLGIAHRDLKIDNLCLDQNMRLKIIDFGFATYFRNPDNTERLSTGICGSDPYVAPEVLLDSHYDPSRADVWSLGIIYICMVSRSFPWDIASHANRNFQAYLDNPTVLSAFLPSALAADIIISILNPTASFRPSVRQILEAPWCGGFQIPELGG
ncbi:Nitrogen permease reactivator protein, partial [Massospora cicadina]